jgi:dimethylamine/trimethylamine dehydrogenase
LRSDTTALEREGILAVYRIGDCFAPRLNVADAIFDGHRLGREIDSNDPETPLQYIRENRVLGVDNDHYDAPLLQRNEEYAPSSTPGRPVVQV